MKLTKQKLKQIIKEEIQTSLDEGLAFPGIAALGMAHQLKKKREREKTSSSQGGLTGRYSPPQRTAKYKEHMATAFEKLLKTHGPLTGNKLRDLYIDETIASMRANDKSWRDYGWWVDKAWDDGEMIIADGSQGPFYDKYWDEESQTFRL
jgi:hypothetical protein